MEELADCGEVCRVVDGRKEERRSNGKAWRCYFIVVDEMWGTGREWNK